MRIGAASVLQETNTFSLNRCRLSDFTVATGEEAAAGARGTNSEMAGIMEGLRAGGAEAVPTGIINPVFLRMTNLEIYADRLFAFLLC